MKNSLFYFAYSYTHSNLGAEVGGGDEAPSNYTPPIAAMLAVLGTIVLTVWQTWGNGSD